MKNIHIVFGFKVACFLTNINARIPILPFLLLLFVYLLHLCIFEGKFHCFYLVFFVLFHVLGIIGLDFELIRNHELIQCLEFNLFLLLVWVGHGPKAMKLDHFLWIVFFIFDQITFFKHFLNDTWVELTVSRKYWFTMCSFVKERAIGFFQNFQEVSRQLLNFVSSVPLDFCSLLFDIYFLYDCVFPFPIFLDETFGQFSDILTS